MAKRVKTKKQRVKEDLLLEMLKKLYKHKEATKNGVLPHIYTSKISSLILNYNNWNKSRYGKSIYDYLNEAVRTYLENASYGDIKELDLVLNQYVNDEELLFYAKECNEDKVKVQHEQLDIWWEKNKGFYERKHQEIKNNNMKKDGN